MRDQENLEATRPASVDPAISPTPGHPASVETLANELGLKLGDQNELTIRRIKRGKSYSFVRANGKRIRHTGTIKRLHSMAVPPAYAEVRYSPDPNSHLQAVGRAIIRTGRRFASSGRRIAWPAWSMRFRKSAATSRCISRARLLPANSRLPR